MTDPQEHIFAIVDANGDLNTQSASGRWAFRTLNPAAERAHRDRNVDIFRPQHVRVARYKFDGWAT
ncbi:hypothetical protein [Dietzia sp. ANT_WB102]|uniref:hypothetical protein n=1 Tax=Dietzia sp. ANT_WB102 TaxID=2597345 RepID=UPI0011ECD68C|nr:hypothetical protein [Dietzia sp. ANT_WB102]KAA0916450.1 hypothetical protein FQ137_14595 [Dietzia sp. ANT_WB102]